MVRLDITVQVVKQWHKDLLDAKDDLSDAESAMEMLSELTELYRPLGDPGVCEPDNLLIFCPTEILFKIPLHAILFAGHPLLDRNPVVYTYSSEVLRRCLGRGTAERSGACGSATFMANPLGDTPAGAMSINAMKFDFASKTHTETDATKTVFEDLSPTSPLLHFHGHVRVDEHPLSNAMIFHSDVGLTAREVFGMDLSRSRPLVVLIGCGSGTERFDTGDEPLGFISAFLFAGAAAVVATMWPIHDRLSGAAFTDAFGDTQGQNSLRGAR